MSKSPGNVGSSVSLGLGCLPLEKFRQTQQCSPYYEETGKMLEMGVTEVWKVTFCLCPNRRFGVIWFYLDFIQILLNPFSLGLGKNYRQWLGRNMPGVALCLSVVLYKVELTEQWRKAHLPLGILCAFVSKFERKNCFLLSVHQIVIF